MDGYNKIEENGICTLNEEVVGSNATTFATTTKYQNFKTDPEEDCLPPKFYHEHTNVCVDTFGVIGIITFKDLTYISDLENRKSKQYPISIY